MRDWTAQLGARDQRWSQRLRVDEKPVWKGIATVVAHFGDGPLWLVLWVAGILLLPAPGRWRVLVWLLASIAAAVVTYAIKFALKRPRPSEIDGFYSKSYDRHAFPSGHATRMGTLPVMGAWVFPPLAPLFWVISLACIWARVALGIHFLGDVVVGWLIGAVVSLLTLALLARFGWPY